MKKKKRKVKAAEAAAAPMDTSGGSSASDQSTIEAAPTPRSTAETKAAVADEPAPVADPMALDNFALSAPVKKLLRAKCIEGLFPIQVRCHGLSIVPEWSSGSWHLMQQRHGTR